ncbi:MAG TPA: hypothetical protein VK090_04925, partial [Paracoccaceae bacterium]|nr:hypothetical protein [Paracoccaceae bacterium]
MASARFYLALFAVVLLGSTVGAADMAEACEGWECAGWPVILIVAAGSATMTAMLSYFVWRHTMAAGPDPFRIENRNWPAFVTRPDGRLISANHAIAGELRGRSTAEEVLAQLLDLTSSDVYRLSRMALRDGLAIRSCTDPQGTPVRLAVTSVGDQGDQRHLWQIQPEGQLAPAGGESRADWDTMPFGYLRISPCSSMSMNAAFLRFFSDEAAGIL